MYVVSIASSGIVPALVVGTPTSMHVKGCIRTDCSSTLQVQKHVFNAKSRLTAAYMRRDALHVVGGTATRAQGYKVEPEWAVECWLAK